MPQSIRCENGVTILPKLVPDNSAKNL